VLTLVLDGGRNMGIIEARGLARTFKSRKRTVEAVRGVDLTVSDGEIVGFLGPNGAGKPVTELRLSLPPGRARWTGTRLALASAAVCRSPETAWHACPQDLPSSVAAQLLPSDTDIT
jgi:ABC-type dipeptide/oligopeptide/nickel transport system ATPase component